MKPDYKNFIFLPDRGFIFSYVPKVACTNWKSLLRYMSGQENWLNSRLAHDKVKGGLQYLDLNGPDIKLLSDPNIRKYAMVRDPFSRTLSAYLNKIESRLPSLYDSSIAIDEDYFHKVVRVIEAYRQENLDSSVYPKISFEVFLQWMINSKDRLYMRLDEHWASQFNLLRLNEVSYDILGRMENLEEDANEILEAMGCEMPFPSQKKVKFAPTNATSKLNAYFSAEAIELVQRYYKCDFDALGYSSKFVART